jgi:hypothetical protein
MSLGSYSSSPKSKHLNAENAEVSQRITEDFSENIIAFLGAPQRHLCAPLRSKCFDLVCSA